MAATAPRLIVLATVLDLQPATGYAVRKRLVEQGVDRWAGMSVASIYSVLRTLTRHGHLDELPDPTGVRADTRAYRVTDQGQEAFLALWSTAATTIDPARPVAFHVAITLRELVPAARWAAGLTARLGELEARLAAPAPQGLPGAVAGALELWRALAETEAAWLRGALAGAP